MNNNIIGFRNITIDYITAASAARAVNDVTLNIEKGKVTAFVGESGSGKTTLVNSVINIIPSPGRVVSGQVLFFENGKEIAVSTLNGKKLNKFRWEKVSMVFQASQSTLNPLMTIYDQFYETAYYHGFITSKEEFNRRVNDLLDLVKLDALRVLRLYPHQLSGGMKQRVAIAFSLLLKPALIILDEPTTALDVITQEYIFNQLLAINRDMGLSMILLTHDIGAVAKMADRVAVMYGGSIMEYADTDMLFTEKLHPYTKGLIEATPSILAKSNEIKPIPGQPPNILSMPEGCPFQDRCERCQDICRKIKPAFQEIRKNHFISCHLYGKGGDKHENT